MTGDSLAAVRARRTVLSVPGSSPRMLEKSQSLPVDEVFLDLEDAVAPDAKESARDDVIAALRSGSWQAATVAVRVNDWWSRGAIHGLVDVVTGAPERVDCLVLPKVETAHDVTAVDRLLTQTE